MSYVLLFAMGFGIVMGRFLIYQPAVLRRLSLVALVVGGGILLRMGLAEMTPAEQATGEMSRTAMLGLIVLLFGLFALMTTILTSARNVVKQSERLSRKKRR